MATSAEVAALAGVSQSTVSYVMSGRRTISAKTRAKVEAAMAELGYQPNAGARALASKRSSVIGLVVRLASTTDMAGVLPFIESVTAEARRRAYDVVLVADEDSGPSMARLAGGGLVDAIVLMDIRSRDARIEAAAGLGVPVVMIGVPADNHGLEAVDFDARRAGAVAVGELVETGHRRVVVIGEPPEVVAEDFGFVADFEGGALAEGERRGVAVEVVRPPEPGWAGITAIAPALLADRERGLGIVARTPQATGWVLQLLLIERLEPGADVALVGLCTDAVAQSFSVPVTNVSPEPYEVTRVAMERVFAQLEGAESTGAAMLVEPRLTHRSTTPSV